MSTSSQALATLEHQLQPLAPRFEAALAGMMPVERLIRTVMVSVERLPALLDCDRQSILMSAMSAACLGLEVDGVTGQAFLIPFKGRAQLVIGYKGYNTLAARSGLTISGAVVREGDLFEYEKGSSAFVRHKPLIDGVAGRRVVAAWACATHAHRPPVVEVLGIDELMAVKAKSPGARRSDSPWNDPAIGFPAMCEKTAKRRLARSLPMSIMQMAARMDEAADEGGEASWITPDRGLEIEGRAAAATPYEESPTPSAARLMGAATAPPAVATGGGAGEGNPGSVTDFDPFEVWEARVNDVLAAGTDTAASLKGWWNAPAQTEARQHYGEAARPIHARVLAEIKRLAEAVPA